MLMNIVDDMERGVSAVGVNKKSEPTSLEAIAVRKPTRPLFSAGKQLSSLWFSK
jgi:hypothetical protein